MKKIEAVYCLLVDETNKKILVVNNKDSDNWSLPGGAVEDYETLEQAIIREVKEETGLEIAVGEIASVNERFFEEEDDRIIFFVFRGEITGGKIEITRPEEIDSVEWMDIDKANKLMPYYIHGISGLLKSTIAYWHMR